jgi:chemotaxis protein methyltransferase CheR
MTSDDDDAALDELLATVFARYHYDFRQYARASLRRRVAAAVQRFGDADVPALTRRVAGDAAAFATLLPYLTLQVSDLFRDPSYFRSFREQVAPILATYPSRRLWVAGCSTGEEAYSLAIILKEEGLLARSRIYATDINPESLRAAEAGVYALDRLRAFSANHRLSGARCALSEHYTAAYDHAVFDRSLREHIVFADHSLATDSVFAEVEVVSCRNVLIYFDRALQGRAVGLFRDALTRRGFLGLGPRETLRFSDHADAFAPFVEADRWYRKLEARP